jgi:hypothetical protein
MKKLLGLLMVLSFVLTLVPATAFAGGPDIYPLMAGQNIDVGTVTVSDDGTDLTVAYEITEEGWFIVQAHMYAGVKAPKKGAPGQFPFHSGPVHDTSFTFKVPLTDLGVASGDELNVAAHAVVNNEFNTIGYMDAEGVIHDEPGADCPTLEEIAAALPESFTIRVVGDGAGYYDVQISGAGDLDGTYDWYCIDEGHNISANKDYTVRVYSSYETLPDAIVNNGTGDNNVDHPENLDLVNWVINNPGSLSQSQVQDVIWALVDDAKSREDLDAAEQAVYDEALLHDGFVPADGQNLAIVLQPVDANDNTNGQVTIGQVTIGQVSFAALGLECVDWTPIYQSETGWAIADGGTPFKGGWGSYFSYLVTE